MAITLYKKRNGKIITTRKSSESGASYAISNYGWSRTKPSSQKSTSKPRSAPSPTRDTSQKTVWKNGKSTVVQGWELPNYQSKGYSTSNNYVAPKPIPVARPAPTSVAKSAPTVSPQASLLQIYNKRPDVKAEAARLFPGQNATTQGTQANTWLNDWYNRTGKAEGADMVQRGVIDLGEGKNLPITVVPKKPMTESFKPGPTTPDVTVNELKGLGERFGISGVGEEPKFRPGLSADQKWTITNLIKTKPQSKWSDQDWENYKWATEGTTNVKPEVTGNPVIDAYNIRPDVQAALTKAFPGQDPFKQGSQANRWLNDWWNKTGKVEMAKQIPVEENIAVPTGDALVDYYSHRPDVKAAAEEAFPGQDPLQQGTQANDWLNNWFETTGKAEMADETSKGTYASTAATTGATTENGAATTGATTENKNIETLPTTPLIDYYNHRPDVQANIAKNFPGQDPFKEGTEANTWLKGWFESNGKAEMADETSKGTYTPAVTSTSDADTIIPNGTSEQKSAFQQIIDKIKEMVGIKKEAFNKAAKEQGLDEKSQKIADVDTLIQDRKEYWKKETDRIKNRLAPMSAINTELGRSESKRIAEMTNLEIRKSIAQGNWDRARQISKESAKDAYDAAALEIKALEVQGSINKDERNNLMDMLKFHKELLLNDFVAITAEDAATLPVNNTIHLPDGSWYALPPNLQKEAKTDTQAITLSDGRIQLIDKATGNIIRTYGTPSPKKTGNYKDKQYQSATYATRMKNSSDVIKDHEKDFKGLAASLWQAGQKIAPNILKSSDRQVYEQAERNFVNALLRQESGAAIAESEFESAKKQYFPQPGDSQAVIDQKRKNRQTSINGMINEAGGAYQGFSNVGGDTNKASLSIVNEQKNGNKGGQCGAFVNHLTGIGVGDSYASKIAKMDKSITTPEPGMVFTMPYKKTGHVGIILSIDDKGFATVKDSNWNLDEKIKTHKIDTKKMTGFTNYYA